MSCPLDQDNKSEESANDNKSIEWIESGALHVPCIELILMDQGFYFYLFKMEQE